MKIRVASILFPKGCSITFGGFCRTKVQLATVKKLLCFYAELTD